MRLLLSLSFPLAVLHAASQKDDAVAAQVSHSPLQPVSGEPVVISVRLSDSAESVALEYQILDPGKYIPLANRAFRSNWQSIPMESSGPNRYIARIPGAHQTHRRLIRYRLKVRDSSGQKIAVPAADSPEPNFAYFVYDGIPPWKAAIQPGRTRPVDFPSAVMDQVQTYFLIARQPDVENATWRQPSSDSEYRYTGTLVVNGRVYDHIRFRARGGVWRHAMGKNMWKIDFHKSNRLQAYDDYGRPYKATWGKLNLRACIQQGDYGRRGEQGMYEAVGFRLFNLAGVDAPRTHWLSLRIIDGVEENPADQYQGDYWGLYLAFENEDGRFLDEHDLPDGNIYKMMSGQGELDNQGKGQPADGSDLQELISAYQGAIHGGWWRKNVHLESYYSYRSILEAIHHYDVSDGKNYTFYRNPKTSRWQVIPWDIDLTWGDHMYGGGREPFMRILSSPSFRLEYQNRLREIRDLLFNPDESGRLIDECAALIWRPRGPSIVDADRAKWDYHPIMASRYVLRGKAGQGLFYQAVRSLHARRRITLSAGQGLFYQAVRSGDFPGMVRQMKDYIVRRASFIDPPLNQDRAIPSTPEITYAGPEGYPASALTFQTTSFDGSGEFAALKWRIGEIDVAPRIMTKPVRPGNYEITPVWESPELAEFDERITVPPATVKSGHTYRARVRMKDATGRWSHWSAPLQFTAK